GDGGVRALADAAPRGGREPALVLNKKGELVFALVAAADPFPEGEGGPSRVHGVKSIKVSIRQPVAAGTGGGTGGGSAPRPQADTAGAQIEVNVDGKSYATWTRVELDKAGAHAVSSEGGEGERNAWSLRDLAKLVDDRAIVTEVVGQDKTV